MTVSDFLARLTDVRKHGNYWKARCPGHEDDHASLSVAEGRKGIVAKCHAGCAIQDILAEMGLSTADLFSESLAHSRNGTRPDEGTEAGRRVAEAAPPRKVEALGTVRASYDYVDAEGALLYQVLRFDPKAFRQRRPSPDGKGWLWDMRGIQRVLYHLPRVREGVARKRPIFVVEGEKDVHTLEKWNLYATTNAGGANKWDADYDRALIGARVVLVPDNDEAGRKHARRIAKRLQGKADVKILFLPGLPEKGDVSDWVSTGGTFDEFVRLVRETPDWAAEPDGSLPEIEVKNRPLREMTDDAMRALAAKNTPPILFIRAGRLVRVFPDERGRSVIETLTIDHVRGYLSLAADFLWNGASHKNPPDAVVGGVRSMGGWQMPRLEGVTETPVMRPDGSVLANSGYDADTRLVYAPADNLALPPIPQSPSRDDVQAAFSLLGEVFGELPYVDQPSRANAWAAVLTPFLRPVIKGRVPLALINAPQAGTGKSTFAELVCILGTGREGALMTAASKEEEWKKSLTATFMEGATIIVIDNIEGVLTSPSLAGALTMAVWKDRVLGASTMVELPIQCTWIATGNNVALGGDLPRRCYPINLDARVAQPWKRVGYKHPHPQTWALANRGKLVAAGLTIARFWFAQGCPTAQVPSMGGYEEWSHVLGCTLAASGIDGFLENLEEMYARTDPTVGQWEDFLRTWREIYGENSKRVAEVVSDLRSTLTQFGALAGPDPALVRLREAIPDDLSIEVEGSVDILKKRLGKALSRKLGVRHGEDELHLKKVTDGHAKVERWSVSSTGTE